MSRQDLLRQGLVSLRLDRELPWWMKISRPSSGWRSFSCPCRVKRMGRDCMVAGPFGDVDRYDPRPSLDGSTSDEDVHAGFFERSISIFRWDLSVIASYAPSSCVRTVPLPCDASGRVPRRRRWALPE